MTDKYQPRRPDIGEQLAAYGARLGIVEPLMISMASHIPAIEAVQADLLAKKDYANADRLRDIAKALRFDAAYAFPKHYKS